MLPDLDTRRGCLVHATVPVLTALASLLLISAAFFALAGASPRIELLLGVAAATTFLLAATLPRSGGARLMARGRLLAGAGLSALLTSAGLWQATSRSGPRALKLLIPMCLLFALAALALREAEVQRRRARQRALRSRLAGEEGERRRWARDLHDDTLQELAGVQVLLGTAAASHDPAVQAAAITDARDAVGRQIQALRRLISRMRPLALDTLGLDAALEDLARNAAEASSIDIQVHTADLPRLPADTETAVYRIVQEALTNAVRHASARRITIEAQAAGRALAIIVRDDGTRRTPTTGPFPPGHGLLGMRERAESLSADLRITAAEPHGTVVRLSVPVPPPARSALQSADEHGFDDRLHQPRQ